MCSQLAVVFESPKVAEAESDGVALAPALRGRGGRPKPSRECGATRARRGVELLALA